MKRLAVLACALSLVAAGCNKSISPTVPSGVVTMISALAGSSNVPPAGSLETGATGSVMITLTPTDAGGNYTASFRISVTGLVKAGVLPSPLDSGSVIVAGYIHQGAAGAPGPPVLALPISQTAPIVTPSGTAQLTVGNVTVPAATATAILANPAGFYFNLYSALNQTGVMRGQLVRQ
jgi:hypothetical protein